MDNKKKEKSEGEKLAEKLLSDKKTVDFALAKKNQKADKFCEGYKSFLNTAKTEREAVIEAVAQAEKQASSLMKRARSMTPATSSIL